MKTCNLNIVFVIISLAVILFQCTPEQILLNGDILGYVTDAETSQPVQSATLTLNQSNNLIDTARSGSDGNYVFNNLTPGKYELEASKPGYASAEKSLTVTSALPTEIDFSLIRVPHIIISSRSLDFGFDSILKSFTLMNSGAGEVNYYIVPGQDWITVYPSSGVVTTEIDTIKVTIDRTEISGKKYEEIIKIVSSGDVAIQDTVEVKLNGIFDRDWNYYGIVTIGTQKWMAENLNTGNEIPLSVEPLNNGVTEKYCYDCETYGGLYTWPEFMNYAPSDSGLIGTTQGICPEGWHIPTSEEWITLRKYAGGEAVAGGKLKATSPLWLPPNAGASDEYGFAALPGGTVARGGNPDPDPGHNQILWIGDGAVFGSSLALSLPGMIPGWPGDYEVWIMKFSGSGFGWGQWFFYEASSVRCIKDP